MSVNRLSTSDIERGPNDVPLVEFMKLQMMYLWWSLCPFNGCTSGGVSMYPVSYTHLTLPTMAVV